MRTKTIEIYKFEELSEEAKQKAIEKSRDINVDHCWWEYTYDDAERIGLKLTSFDLDRNRHAKGEFIDSAESVAQKIIEDHGKDCETYKTAKKFLSELQTARENFEAIPENDGWEFEYDHSYELLREEFEQELLEDYSMILQKEMEYLTSEEAIKETIVANEWEFTIDGKVYR